MVSLPSGLQYKVIASGPKDGPSPKLGDIVKVNYEGKLLNGTVFDSSFARGKAAIMPADGLIQGWLEALPKMKVGDEWMLFIPGRVPATAAKPIQGHAFREPPSSDEFSSGVLGRQWQWNHNPDWFSARRLAECIYGHKVLIDEDTDLILGAHLVGPQADEVINIFGLAIRHGLTAADVRRHRGAAHEH